MSDLTRWDRLAQQAVASWQGPRESIRIITKVGLVRPAGKWIPNGAPKHIRQSVATKQSSLLSSINATKLTLDVSDRTALSIKYAFEADEDAAAAIKPPTMPSDLPKLNGDAGPGDTAEIVLLMGI